MYACHMIKRFNVLHETALLILSKLQQKTVLNYYLTKNHNMISWLYMTQCQMNIRKI